MIVPNQVACSNDPEEVLPITDVCVPLTPNDGDQ